MNETASIDDQLWYVVHTKSRQEERAYNNLCAWHLEAFFPKIKERRVNPYTGSPTYVSKGLFPRYIFARFNSDRLLHEVRFTRGVHSVLGIDGIPTSVQDEFVTLIQDRLDQNGFVKMDNDLRLGDRVVINDGPLGGLRGIFKTETGEDKRVIILLESVSYQARIVVERATVQKYSGH